MASIHYVFDVWQHYPDDPPEEFGMETLDHIPKPGEHVMLHWVDGREAYEVVVTGVDPDRLRLDVKASGRCEACRTRQRGCEPHCPCPCHER